MSRKLALIIGNNEYQDQALNQLLTPGEDVNDLAGVLRALDIGAFDEVTTLINESSTLIRLEIESFFAEKKPDDLLLMYFSGHGVRDDQGQLYLAVKDTRHNRLRATAIPAAFVTDGMDHSRSRRQVLILDCCHSGAFAQGAKGVTGESVGTKTAFEGVGYGRVVLTATDATQYAWEGDQVIGQAENSVFTHYMIEGLKTGAADTDGDGRITLDELYDYVYEQVVVKTPRQTPGKWSYKQQGELVIARNPRPAKPKPTELPVELRQMVESPVASAREAAVHELSNLLSSRLPGLAPAAHEALKRLESDDSRRVAAASAEVLKTYAEPQSQVEHPAIETPASARRAPERAVAEPRADRPETAPARSRTWLWIATPLLILVLIAGLALWLARGPAVPLQPTGPANTPSASPSDPGLGQPELPGEFASVVPAYVNNVSAVRAIPLSTQANDDWWFYDSSQPTLSGGRLSLPGTDDFYSAIVRRVPLQDNMGALLVFSLSGATTDPGWCEIGVSGELEQATAYLLLCEDPFRAIAGQYGASILENVVPLTADPAPNFRRAVDVEYGLLIARGLQNRVQMVIWQVEAPAEQAAFSIEGHPYLPNYFFAKPYPGVLLTVRDFIEIEFESLK